MRKSLEIMAFRLLGRRRCGEGTTDGATSSRLRPVPDPDAPIEIVIKRPLAEDRFELDYAALAGDLKALGYELHDERNPDPKIENCTHDLGGRGIRQTG